MGMTDVIIGSFEQIFGQLPRLFGFAIGSVTVVLLAFFGVKAILRLRGNSAFTSFDLGVVAPVQYGDRGAKESRDERFSKRLEEMVETEENYDLEKLMPKARELGAIAKSSFHTAPVIAKSNLAVLALIEECVSQSKGGFRVLMHARLESLIDMEDPENSPLMKRSLSGIDLTFAVVDRYGRLVVAIDHDSGEKKTHQMVLNRAVVMEVLRKAGVWYLEIPQHYSPEDARRQLLQVLHGYEGQHEDVA